MKTEIDLSETARVKGLNPVQRIWAKANSVAHTTGDSDFKFRKDRAVCVRLVYPKIQF